MQLSAQQIYDYDRAHVFHSWSAQAALDPLVITKTDGSYVWDGSGRRLLDFSSQLVFTNVGHQHPRVVAAIQEQAGTIATLAPQHATEARSLAAHLIAEVAPPGLDRVFFTNGGTEAVEHASRMARQHTGRPKLLSAYRSYHGATSTAINLTGDQRRWPSDTGTAGVVHFLGPFLYRSPFGSASEAEECERALAHLEQVIQLEGPETIAGLFLETVPGTAGIMPPPDGYLAGVRERCDRYGIVYIADEVMAGFGRTGRWFALDHWDVRPDLITFAKGVNSGYVPLGGVIISEPIAATFADRPYPGGLTYSGHPLACAAAVATITVMRDEHVLDNAERIGRDVLGPGLHELADRHEIVGNVRGLGAFWALELVSDRGSKEPLRAGPDSAMELFVTECRSGGLLPLVVQNRVHVVPPCTVGDTEIDDGLEVLDVALRAVYERFGNS